MSSDRPETQEDSQEAMAKSLARIATALEVLAICAADNRTGGGYRHEVTMRVAKMKESGR